MYQEEIQNTGALAAQKYKLLHGRPVAYFISAMQAGAFVGFGVLLSFTAGGLLTADGVPAVKLIMGACFGVALSLVIMAGAELFTGNTFIMTVGCLQKGTPAARSRDMRPILGRQSGWIRPAGPAVPVDWIGNRGCRTNHGRYGCRQDGGSTRAALCARDPV